MSLFTAFYSSVSRSRTIRLKFRESPFTWNNVQSDISFQNKRDSWQLGKTFWKKVQRQRLNSISAVMVNYSSEKPFRMLQCFRMQQLGYISKFTIWLCLRVEFVELGCSKLNGWTENFTFYLDHFFKTRNQSEFSIDAFLKAFHS